jgi:hypothetical protein
MNKQELFDGLRTVAKLEAEADQRAKEVGVFTSSEHHLKVKFDVVLLPSGAAVWRNLSLKEAEQKLEALACSGLEGYAEPVFI